MEIYRRLSRIFAGRPRGPSGAVQLAIPTYQLRQAPNVANTCTVFIGQAAVLGGVAAWPAIHEPDRLTLERTSGGALTVLFQNADDLIFGQAAALHL